MCINTINFVEIANNFVDILYKANEIFTINIIFIDYFSIIDITFI